MVEALNQKERQPMPVAEQVASIFSGTEGHLDRIKTERVTDFLEELIGRLHSENQDLLDRINETGKLSDEDEEALDKAVEQMVDDFGPDFDKEGNPLEEGESDRVKAEGQREEQTGSDADSGSSEDGDSGKAEEREEAGATA